MKKLAALPVAVIFSFAILAQHFNPLLNSSCDYSSNNNDLNIEFVEGNLEEKKWINFPTKAIQLDSIIDYKFTTNEDSVLWIKNEYLYDDNENVSLDYQYEWIDEANKWNNVSKTKYTYDEFGNMLSHERANWDNDLMLWVNDLKYVRTYDQTGNETLLIDLLWNPNINDWEYRRKSEHEYDNDGNMLLWKHWEWDTISDQWIGKHKKEQVFNEISQFEMIIFFQWDFEISDWEQYARHEYTYDSNTFLILDKHYYLDDISGELIYTGKTEYMNDEYGKPDSIFNYSLELWSKELFAYDENQNLLSATSLKLYNVWRYDTKSEYLYDENSFQILSSYSNWDFELDDWYETGRREKAYNADGNYIFFKLFDYDEVLEQLIGIFFFDCIYNENGDWLMVAENLWDNATNDWFLDAKFYYYYSNPSLINKVSENIISIYPNPVKSYLNIECEKIINARCSVIDLSGKEIKNFELRGGINKINLEFLPPGIYLIQYTDGTKLNTRKIIKQ